MNKVFIDENKKFQFDFSAAEWATNQIHDFFMESINGSILSDVDFVCQDSNGILLVEYKNANIPNATNPEGFKPSSDKLINKIVYKFYDTMLFLNHCGFVEKMNYIYILEHLNGDTTSRKMIREKIAKKLPFQLQKNSMITDKMISSFEVLSIEEWNSTYSQYPITIIK